MRVSHSSLTFYVLSLQIVQAVKHRSLLFNETSTSLQYKIIDYLISQVQVTYVEFVLMRSSFKFQYCNICWRFQAARLIYHKKQSEMVIDEHDVDIGEIDTSMDVVYDDCIDTIERSKVAFQLDKICKLLQLGVPGDADEHVILHTLVSYIRDKIQHCPDLLSNGPGLILRDVGELSPQQTAKLNSVEELLFKVRTVFTDPHYVLNRFSEKSFYRAFLFLFFIAICTTGLRAAAPHADEAHGGDHRVLPVERQGLQQRGGDPGSRARPAGPPHRLACALHGKY